MWGKVFSIKLFVLFCYWMPITQENNLHKRTFNVNSFKSFFQSLHKRFKRTSIWNHRRSKLKPKYFNTEWTLMSIVSDTWQFKLLLLSLSSDSLPPFSARTHHFNPKCYFIMLCYLLYTHHFILFFGKCVFECVIIVIHWLCDLTWPVWFLPLQSDWEGMSF